MVLVFHSGMEAAGMDITTEHIVIGIFSFFSIACGKQTVIDIIWYMYSIAFDKRRVIRVSYSSLLLVVSTKSST
jgi:hypothetical protein